MVACGVDCLVADRDGAGLADEVEVEGGCVGGPPGEAGLDADRDEAGLADEGEVGGDGEEEEEEDEEEDPDEAELDEVKGLSGGERVEGELGVKKLSELL